MMRGLAAAALLLVAILEPRAAHAEAPEWTVDLDASEVGFTARQMQVSVPGRFARFSADIRFAADDLEASAAELVIDVASVETPNPDIEDTIKLADWFDVGRFPEARFKSSGIEHVEGDRYAVSGELTLRGVTHPVLLPLTIEIADDPDDSGMLRARAEGEIAVSRLAFGIGQGQWEDVSVVPDEVVVRVEIVARRTKP